MNATQARNWARADIEPEVLAARARDLGFRLADRDELQAAVSMAESLIDGKLASVDAISAMNVQTGMTAWVTGDPVDGIFLTIPLSAEGEAAVRNGSYVLSIWQRRARISRHSMSASMRAVRGKREKKS